MKTNTDKIVIVELTLTEAAAINGGKRGRGKDDPQPHQ